MAEIEKMTPQQLVQGINTTWEGRVDLFGEEKVSWARRMAQVLCRHPQEALDFATSLKPGHASKEAIRSEIYKILAGKEPGMAIAALAAVPTEGRRTAVSELNKLIPPGSPHAAEFESRLNAAEKYSRHLSPITDKAREPGRGREALAQVAEMPGMGVLGRAQARRQVMTTWMTNQPAEFADWLGSVDVTALPDAMRNTLREAVDKLPKRVANPEHRQATEALVTDLDASPERRQAAEELRARLKILLAPRTP